MCNTRSDASRTGNTSQDQVRDCCAGQRNVARVAISRRRFERRRLLFASGIIGTFTSKLPARLAIRYCRFCLQVRFTIRIYLLFLLIFSSETSLKASSWQSSKGPGSQDVTLRTRLRSQRPNHLNVSAIASHMYPRCSILSSTPSYSVVLLAPLPSCQPSPSCKCLVCSRTSRLNCRHEFAGKNSDRPNLHTLQVRCYLLFIAAVGLKFQYYALASCHLSSAELSVSLSMPLSILQFLLRPWL
jgi:hypothetical protein